MSTRFFLILSGTSSPARYELTAAISGDVEGWDSTSRHFASRADVEAALRNSKVLAAIGPSQSLDVAASNVPVAFALESAAPAIALQVLRRTDPQTKTEKTMVTFNDLNGSLLHSTAHYERRHPITVGEILEVDTPLGRRSVEVVEITKDEVSSYGSDDTRRNVHVNVRF